MAVSDIVKEEYVAVWPKSRDRGVKQDAGGWWRKGGEAWNAEKEGKTPVPEPTPAVREPPSEKGNRTP